MNSLKILDIFVGNQCNLTCLQCDTRSDQIRNNKLDPDLEKTKLGISLAMRNFKIDNFSLLGGEPLLYIDKTKKLLEYIRSLDASTNIFLPTNGTLINRFQNEVINLLEDYKITLSVSNHFSAFLNKTLSSSLMENCNVIIKKLNLEKISMYEIEDRHFDLENRANDLHWDDFLKITKKHNDEFNGIHAYANKDRSIVILFKDQNTFKSHYRLEAGKPKPFMTGDPHLSYQKGCCSPFCNFMFETKLYKCGALGTLKRFLEFHNIENDRDWRKYLSYHPLDLENCTETEVEEFSNSKFRSIEQCDMCPSSNNFSIKKTPETVIPIKNYKLP
jgi:organic radical activating enzyme